MTEQKANILKRIDELIHKRQEELLKSIVSIRGHNNEMLLNNKTYIINGEFKNVITEEYRVY